MLSQAMFDEFLAPYYTRTVPAFRERNIIVLVDSDGDVTEMIPWFEQVGVQGLLPLERRAGVDVAAIRAAHPRLRMIGGFDKAVIKDGPKPWTGSSSVCCPPCSRAASSAALTIRPHPMFR